MSNELLYKLRIPESDIVVTRKVPMTNDTCTQLRLLQAEQEQLYAQSIGVDVKLVKIELPTLLANLIGDAFERSQQAI